MNNIAVQLIGIISFIMINSSSQTDQVSKNEVSKSMIDDYKRRRPVIELELAIRVREEKRFHEFPYATKDTIERFNGLVKEASIPKFPELSIMRKYAAATAYMWLEVNLDKNGKNSNCNSDLYNN